MITETEGEHEFLKLQNSKEDRFRIHAIFIFLRMNTQIFGNLCGKDNNVCVCPNMVRINIFFLLSESVF